ncbi:uncharacterized protein [Macaca fascicularis]|uniref:uncharacterized protein n=1 Tax=Macaca fascicularis TaxID=9541 RepID=UPI0032B088AD
MSLCFGMWTFCGEKPSDGEPLHGETSSNLREETGDSALAWASGQQARRPHFMVNFHHKEARQAVFRELNDAAHKGPSAGERKETVAARTVGRPGCHERQEIPWRKKSPGRGQQPSAQGSANPGPLWQSSETDRSSAPRKGAVLESRPRTGLEVTRLQPPNPHHRPSSTPRLVQPPNPHHRPSSTPRLAQPPNPHHRQSSTPRLAQPPNPHHRPSSTPRLAQPPNPHHRPSSTPRLAQPPNSPSQTIFYTTAGTTPKSHHRPSSTPWLAPLGRVEPEIGTFVWRLVAWEPRDPESLSPGGLVKDIFTR